MVFLLGMTVTLLCRSLRKRLVVEENLRQAKEKAEGINEQLQASHQQLGAMNKQLQTNEQQLRANNQQLQEEITERRQAIEELERFNRLAVGRELRMVELKKQVNALLNELGREEEYRNLPDITEPAPAQDNA